MIAIFYGLVATATTLAMYLIYGLNAGQLVAVYYGSAAVCGLVLQGIASFNSRRTHQPEELLNDPETRYEVFDGVILLTPEQ